MCSARHQHAVLVPLQLRTDSLKQPAHFHAQHQILFRFCLKRTLRLLHKTQHPKARSKRLHRPAFVRHLHPVLALIRCTHRAEHKRRGRRALDHCSIALPAITQRTRTAGVRHQGRRLPKRTHLRHRLHAFNLRRLHLHRHRCRRTLHAQTASRHAHRIGSAIQKRRSRNCVIRVHCPSNRRTVLEPLIRQLLRTSRAHRQRQRFARHKTPAHRLLDHPQHSNLCHRRKQRPLAIGRFELIIAVLKRRHTRDRKLATCRTRNRFPAPQPAVLHRTAPKRSPLDLHRSSWQHHLRKWPEFRKPHPPHHTHTGHRALHTRVSEGGTHAHLIRTHIPVPNRSNPKHTSRSGSDARPVLCPLVN